MARRHEPRKSKDVPVTREMLYKVRDELKRANSAQALATKALGRKMDAQFSKIDARFSKMDARFSKIDSRFSSIDSKFLSIDARFSNIDARFFGVESKLEKVLEAVHRVELMVEEQKSQNRFVLDGYASLNDRIEKLESSST